MGEDIVLPGYRRSYYSQERFDEELNALGIEICPHIDLSIVQGIQISPTRGRGMVDRGGIDLDYAEIRRAILLEDLKDQFWWKRRFSSGLDHIPLIFDYISNAGYFYARIVQLGQYFKFRRVSLLHHFKE